MPNGPPLYAHLPMHNFRTRETFTGNFAVFGSTGSGKTTFIKSMVARTYREFEDQKQQPNRVGGASVTVKNHTFEGPEVETPDPDNSSTILIHKLIRFCPTHLETSFCGDT